LRANGDQDTRSDNFAIMQVEADYIYVDGGANGLKRVSYLMQKILLELLLLKQMESLVFIMRWIGLIKFMMLRILTRHRRGQLIAQNSRAWSKKHERLQVYILKRVESEIDQTGCIHSKLRRTFIKAFE
jgi:hypothetical protein